MKTLFMLAFAANVVLTLVSLCVLPNQVAINFGPGGAPNSWASKEVHSLIMLAVEVPLFLLLLYAPSLTMKFPPRFVNLPNKEYWLRQENRPALRRKLGSLMNRFGTALYVFLFCIGSLTLLANLSEPVRLNERAFFPVLVLFLGYTVFWCIRLFKSFRVPD